MVLDHGRIIERGSHDELMAEKGEYYQLYFLMSSKSSLCSSMRALISSKFSFILSLISGE